MPIILPQVDYGPLYRAIGLKGSAEQARFGVQSLDIASRVRDLQRRQRTADLVYGIGKSLLDLGQTVYGLFEQQKFEQVKGELHDYSQLMQEKLRTIIANNQYELTKDAEGNDVIKLDPEFDRWYQQSVDQINEQYRNFGRVRSWAKDQLYQMYDTGKNQVAMGFAMKQGLQLRDQDFQTNLTNAMTDAINAGDFAPVEAVITSARWLGTEGQKALLTDQRRVFELGMQGKNVRAIAAAQGYAAAADYVKSLSLSEEDTQNLLKKATDQHNETLSFHMQQAETAYQAGKDAGRTGAEVIDQILAPIPEAYKGAVENALRAKQASDVHNRTTYEFNMVRDNLSELNELYGKIRSDEAGVYDGIPEQHRKDLEMLATEIAQKEREQGGPSRTEEKQWADTQLQYIWQSYIRGDINAMQARADADRIGLLAHPAQYNELMRRIAQEVAPQIEPIMKGIGQTTERAMMTAWGLKDKKQLTADQMLQISSAASHISRTAFDIFQENPKISPAELSERLQPLFEAFYAKEYDVLRKPIEERVLESSERQLAQIQGKIDSGELDDFVFEDLEGKRYFHPAVVNNLQMLWAREQSILEEKLGQPVIMQLSPQGWDVGALSVFTDAGGKKYVFRSEAGELVPYILEGKELQRLEPPKEPVPAPRPEPISEEHRELLRNLGAQTIVPAAVPGRRQPLIIGPGMTPEEAERAYRQIRGGM